MIDQQVVAIAKETIADNLDNHLKTLEELQLSEAQVISRKQELREDLIRAKENDLFNTEEKQKRLLIRKSSIARVSVRNLLSYKEQDKEEGFLDLEAKWEIKPSDVEINEKNKLGKGQFGTVYKGKLLGKDVAVKRLLVQSFNDTKAEEEFVKEVKIMR